MGKIQAAVADLEQRLADLKTAINDELESLPDNPKIKRLNDQCFVVSSKELGKNWSPGFHDFKDQYRYSSCRR
jgi:hypothetical protein